MISGVKERIRSGGVYIGVGPEQNFNPTSWRGSEVSFIVDIRRLNLLEHLLYKAIFELAEERADFISLLFSQRVRRTNGEHRR